MVVMIWLMLYIYFFFQCGQMIKGKLKNSIFLLLCFGLVFVGWILQLSWLAWIVVAIVVLLFDLFYDEESLKVHWKTLLVPLVILFLGSIWQNGSGLAQTVVIHQVFFCCLFALLAWKRGYQYRLSVCAILIGYFLLLLLEIALIYDLFGQMEENLRWKVQVFLMILGSAHFIMQEISLRQYHSGYEKNAANFQKNLMQQQYEEIKLIYLNMRGWRHDYHNHLQVLKAQMDHKDFKGARKYLNDLEEELQRVDTYVRSGNAMIDAVLNSKVSLAVERGIAVNCTAIVNEEISVLDVDLCVIFGNILDNAIEACNQIKQPKRFIRIYVAVQGKQLYLSIQNAAKEELDFSEKNYISKKRGNHGLGMKRVAAIIDKYEGYLNLSNEAGIFGTEVIIPLFDQDVEQQDELLNVHFTKNSDDSR